MTAWPTEIEHAWITIGAALLDDNLEPVPHLEAAEDLVDSYFRDLLDSYTSLSRANDIDADLLDLWERFEAAQDIIDSQLKSIENARTCAANAQKALEEHLGRPVDRLALIMGFGVRFDDRATEETND